MKEETTPMRRRVNLSLVVIVFVAGCGRSKQPPGKFIRADSIDIVTLSWRGSQRPVRLIGIASLPGWDAIAAATQPIKQADLSPEQRRAQMLTRRATTLLRNLLLNKKAYMRTDGRPLTSEDDPMFSAYVHAAGKDVGAELLAQGLALADKNVDHPRREQYLRLERQAKAAKLGWWGDQP